MKNQVLDDLLIAFSLTPVFSVQASEKKKKKSTSSVAHCLICDQEGYS